MDTTALPPPDPPETCDHCGSNIIPDPRFSTLWGHNDTHRLFTTIHTANGTNGVFATPRAKR